MHDYTRGYKATGGDTTNQPERKTKVKMGIRAEEIQTKEERLNINRRGEARAAEPERTLWGKGKEKDTEINGVVLERKGKMRRTGGRGERQRMDG